MDWWGDYGWAAWLALAMGLGVAEMLTLDLVLGMVAIGAVVGMAGALVGLAPVLQVLLAAAGSVTLLALVRPSLVRRLHSGPDLVLGADKLIGQQAVAEAAFDRHTPGSITVGGELWTARPYDETVRIEAGETVEVLQIQGATALVHPVPRLEG